MFVLKFLFWFSLAVGFYTYLGYGIIVWAWAKSINYWRPKAPLAPYQPPVTLVVPAYNEADILVAKIKNCLALEYPADRLQLVFITDGSTDNSADVLAAYPQIQHLHQPARGGKSLAENRAMEFVKTALVIFTDCNSYLNPEAVTELVKHYQNPQVGAVSGEKKVLSSQPSVSGAGEGLYWQYESFLKKCDSDIYSLMGAAGELVSFRSDLFQPLEKDTILDDFVQSLRIVEKGYRVVYEPRAYALEAPSASLAEEMKRKVRICAGAWQSMGRLTTLLNPFFQPVVTFLYVSHRVLRWSLTPLLLALLIPLSILLALLEGGVYTLILTGQALFYGGAWLAWLAEAKGKKMNKLLVPLYFTLMNLAVFAGFWRYLQNKQPAAWEKAARHHPLSGSLGVNAL